MCTKRELVSMTGSSIIEHNGGRRMIEGQFRLIDGVYELVLRESADGHHRESTHTFTSIEHLADYLESNTALRLGDFKPVNVDCPTALT